MKTTLLSSLLYFFFIAQLYATHNNAGEISYRQLSNQSIECTITTYTRPIIEIGERDSLIINWGDGQTEFVTRVNGPDTDGDGIPDGKELYNGFTVNQYVAIHTYEALGSYILSMTDPNRSAGILNVDFPNSVSVAFHLQTEIELSADFNSSPILLNPPVDIAIMGEVFLHTPNAFDIDDDSLSYAIVTPRQGINEEVPNYVPLTNADNFGINKQTGLIRWDSPNQAGEYTIAIEITSYRNGQVIDKTIRDMNILVRGGDDPVPSLNINTTYSQTEPNTVMVGETVSIEVSSMDMNSSQTITLRSNSGLYEFFDNPAAFIITEENGNSGAAVFSWVPTTEHVRNYPLQLVIKSSDDLGLANYRVLRFKVEDITSSEDLPPAQDINIYPNPVASVLNLDAEEKLSGNYQIYDLRGRLLQSGGLENTNEVQVENLPAGQYYLQVKDRPLIPFVKQ